MVFVLTWPTLPAVYYGDEIGMQYQPGLPDFEGSVLGPPRAGYNRAGSRTPMQWDANDPDVTYLPPHPSPERPNVADSTADPDSLLNLVRELIALRKANPALGSGGGVEILNPGYPFVYRRGEFTVALNPSFTPVTADTAAPGALVLGSGATHENGRLHLDRFSYAIYRAG
jgi:maltose alpha-D-glucosyltransferase/alpha-amylase